MSKLVDLDFRIEPFSKELLIPTVSPEGDATLQILIRHGAIEGNLTLDNTGVLGYTTRVDPVFPSKDLHSIGDAAAYLHPNDAISVLRMLTLFPYARMTPEGLGWFLPNPVADNQGDISLFFLGRNNRSLVYNPRLFTNLSPDGLVKYGPNGFASWFCCDEKGKATLSLLMDHIKLTDTDGATTACDLVASLHFNTDTTRQFAHLMSVAPHANGMVFPSQGDIRRVVNPVGYIVQRQIV